MKLPLFLLGAIAAQEYEYDDFGNKKRKNKDGFTSGVTDPCGCENVPRNSPAAFGNCNMTATELGNLPSNKQMRQKARVKIWWTCLAADHSGVEDIHVLFNQRCKSLKKKPLASPWPMKCGNITPNCKCNSGMTAFMTDVGGSANFECTDDGRKHSSYRVWCDDGDGIFQDGESNAVGRVKCGQNGLVRRAKGDLKNFSCAAVSGTKKKNKFFG
ncbi:unnamed protein product [Oikopleura dioica]|uniref:Uncharacterized protein n=1 Tax=Oikopleura dioica TaxID=34765 RepID=E4XWW8_OIKDI|nr:unnamed protein product [Oikopleura dioica]